MQKKSELTRLARLHFAMWWHKHFSLGCLIFYWDIWEANANHYIEQTLNCNFYQLAWAIGCIIDYFLKYTFSFSFKNGDDIIGNDWKFHLVLHFKASSAPEVILGTNITLIVKTFDI